MTKKKIDQQEIEEYIIGNKNLPDYFKRLAKEKMKRGKQSQFWLREAYKALIRTEKYLKP